MEPLWKRIETILSNIVAKEIPDADQGALMHYESGSLYLDTSFINNDEIDEIDLTELSHLLADAIEVKVDPPEEV